MKKTTTRLASIAALLIMSAFAIVLAQHDARKRDRREEPMALAGSSSEPTDPIAADLVWPGKPPIVRGNNGKLPGNSNGSTDISTDLPTHSDGGGIQVHNSLREDLVAYDLDSHSVRRSGVSPYENGPMSPVAGETGNGGTGDGGYYPTGATTLSTIDTALLTAERASGDLALPSTELAGWQSSGDTGQSSGDRQSSGDTEQLLPGEALDDGQNAGAAWSGPVGVDARYPLESAVVAASGQQPALPAWLPDGAMTSGSPTSSLPAPAPVATLSNPQPSIGTSLPSQSQPPSWEGTTSHSPFPPVHSTNLQGTSSVQGGPGVQSGSGVPSFTSGEDVASGTVSTASIAGSSSNSGRPFESGARAALVSNQPGSRFLDGSQNPIMQIHKRAPEEIQVGKKATFVITVRNAGNATAHDVIVIDRVPQGARFAESSPSATPTSEGVLTWTLGEMSAGDERTISLQIIPEVEGEVGSVASVHFAAQASVRTVATLPQLVLQVDSVGPVIIGQSQQVVVSIQNTGSGVARGVRLEADIPVELRHESGETQLEAYVGDLRPSESRRLTLGVAAVQPGQSQCVLRAVNDDGVHAERAIAIDVRAPQLASTISGPSLRYLERQANYQVVVTNSGTAIARNLDFVVHLPVGLKFVSADIPQATYNPQTHSVSLGLAELDSGQSAPFSLTVLPVQLGPQAIRFNGSGDLGIATEAKAQVTVAGLAELSFTIGQDNGTVEVGASTTYAVQVTNIGNQPDKNVQLTVQLPEGTKLLQVDAPVEHRFEGGRIVFAPVSEMRNRDVKTFRFQIQHNRAGNQVVRSQLTSENWPVAVVKEEGTLVYNDRN